jgi:peptidoglycan/LPS O-acetylase OafA/YrhL
VDSAGLVARTRRRPGRAGQTGHGAPKPNTTQRLQTFRPDIQGLRAVAIVTVVVFHAGVPGFGGGFIGVDIFFVISGFLITGLLRRDVSATGTVRLRQFYGARARRLLPAGCLVLVTTAVASTLLLPPFQARNALADGIASALYVGNYRFAVEGTDYLAADAAPSPFQHYWSLGVEEQFYLIWPALIIGAAWLLRRRQGADTESRSSRPYLMVLAVVAVVSFALSLNLTSTSPPWAFFSLPTRAWELAAGGLVALTATVWQRLPSAAAAIISGVGMTMIILACTLLGVDTPYPGTAALLPVLGAALLIGSGCAATQEGVNRFLSLPLMQAVGRLSYSWYLWHWPVLLLAPYVLGHPIGLGERLIFAAASGGLAALTLVLVENPARYAATLRGSATRSLVLGGVATATAVIATLVLMMLRPIPTGQGAAASPVAVRPPTNATTAGDPYDTAVHQVIDQIQSAVADSIAIQQIPSNLSPSLADAPADKPDVFLNGCVRSWHEVGQSECASGDTAAPMTVALVGDSHAAMWSPAFEDLAAQRHWRLETLGKITCPLQDLPIVSPYLGREYTECEQWRDEVLSRLQKERAQLVVVSMSRRYGADFGFTSYDKAWIDSLTRLVARLHNTGAKVLVLGPIPDPHSNVPACLSEHVDHATACGQPRDTAVNEAGIRAEAAATAAGGGHYDDLTPLFCTPSRCPMVVGNTLVYRDDNHVTIEYARALTPVVATLVDRALNK